MLKTMPLRSKTLLKKSSIFVPVTIISPVKREKGKREAAKQAMHDLRESLPILTKEDIRRYRLSYHEAILMDLEEQKRPSSAAYLKQLVDYQEELRRQHGPDTKVWSRPRLVDERAEIDRLAGALKRAETAHYDERYSDECDELLKMAVYYGFGPEDWWWLGQQFLIQNITVCCAYQGDGGRREAQSKYLYGKFALENLKDVELAKLNLGMSRSLAMGRAWIAKAKLGRNQQTIFVESCILLYKTLMLEAKALLETDPKRATAVCTVARRRALDACDHLGEADVLMLMGTCETSYRDTIAATISFERALRIYLKFNQIVNQCEARIHLALTYLVAGRWANAMEQLEKLHETARQNGLPFYEGQAYRFLGEYYLNQGNASMATPILIKALHIFHKLNTLMERDQVRNLAAISAGQELIPEYTKIISKSGSPSALGHESLLKLLMWKDAREFFWDLRRASALSAVSGVSSAVEDDLFSELSAPGAIDEVEREVEIQQSRSYHDHEEQPQDDEHMKLIQEAKALLSYKSGSKKTKSIFKKF